MTPRRPPRSRRSRWRRIVLRRVAAGACLAVALWVVTSDRSVGTRTTEVIVASRDVPAGAVVTGADVGRVARPEADVPDSALTEVDAVVGQTVTVAVSAAEVFTPSRLAGPGTLAGLPPGYVAVPVPLLVDAASGLVRAGDRIDLYAPGSRAATTRDTLVLAVLGGDPGPGSWGTGSAGATTVLVAAGEGDAAALLAARVPDAPTPGYGFALRRSRPTAGPR